MKEMVLLIEDDELISTLLLTFFEIQNFKVFSAEDGFSGLQLAKELRPDLIICDMNLPNLNGFEVLKGIREDFTTAKIPFIFYTSECDPDSRRRAMGLGANDYLIKPTKLNQLLESVTNQCKLAKRESQEVSA